MSVIRLAPPRGRWPRRVRRRGEGPKLARLLRAWKISGKPRESSPAVGAGVEMRGWAAESLHPGTLKEQSRFLS